MFKDYFDVDPKYEVKQHLSLDHFFQSANLTPSEKNKLKRYLTSIDILYDIHCYDRSEFIIVEVEVKYLQDRWTALQIAQSIGASFPYPCMVMIIDGEYSYICALEKRENKINNNRNMLERSCKTPGFSTAQPDALICSFFRSFSEAVHQNSYNATELSQLCIELVEEIKAKSNLPFYDRPLPLEITVKPETEVAPPFVRLIGNTVDVDVDEQINYCNRFLEEICELSYPLFDEYNKSLSEYSFGEATLLDIETHWLADYIDSAIEFLRSNEKCELTDDGIAKIYYYFYKRDSYYSGYSVYKDDMELMMYDKGYSVDYLKSDSFSEFPEEEYLEKPSRVVKVKVKKRRNPKD